MRNAWSLSNLWSSSGSGFVYCYIAISQKASSICSMRTWPQVVPQDVGLVWFRKLGKKNKVDEKMRVSRCLEKRDSGAGIYFCID